MSGTNNTFKNYSTLVCFKILLVIVKLCFMVEYSTDAMRKSAIAQIYLIDYYFYPFLEPMLIDLYQKYFGNKQQSYKLSIARSYVEYIQKITCN